MKRWAVFGAVCLSLAALFGVLWSNASNSTKDEPPTVIMVVLDTVRSDHLGLCGYHRPTSPFLERWVQEPGVSYTCDAYTPGSWTLPSHASFFTGRGVVEHGADMYASGKNTTAVPLSTTFETLAEHMVGKGYQTALLSANPVIKKEMGLTRGFERVFHAKEHGAVEGTKFARKLTGLLDRLKPDKPLFLFLNIADAHEPWRAVPEGLDWVESQAAFSTRINNPSSAFHKYVRGTLDAGGVAQLRKRYTNGYDYDLFWADKTLENALDMLRERGYLEGNYRIVVTSDHGEFLAERGLVVHGGYLYEGNVRVPLIYATSDTSEKRIVWPEPASATSVFFLARDGALPAKPLPVLAIARPHLRLMRIFNTLPGLYRSTSVALWQGRKKWMWIDGRLKQYNLDSDPDEKNPSELPSTDAPDALQNTLSKMSKPGRRTFHINQETVDQLKALGYAE